MQANLLPSLIHMMAHENYEIAKMAMRAIYHALTKRSPQLQYIHNPLVRAFNEWHYVSGLVEQGVIPSLCSFLKISDVDSLIFALEGLKTILRAGAYGAAMKS